MPLARAGPTARTRRCSARPRRPAREPVVQTREPAEVPSRRGERHSARRFPPRRQPFNGRAAPSASASRLGRGPARGFRLAPSAAGGRGAHTGTRPPGAGQPPLGPGRRPNAARSSRPPAPRTSPHPASRTARRDRGSPTGRPSGAGRASHPSGELCLPWGRRGDRPRSAAVHAGGWGSAGRLSGAGRAQPLGSARTAPRLPASPARGGLRKTAPLRRPQRRLAPEPGHSPLFTGRSWGCLLGAAATHTAPPGSLSRGGRSLNHTLGGGEKNTHKRKKKNNTTKLRGEKLETRNLPRSGTRGETETPCSRPSSSLPRRPPASTHPALPPAAARPVRGLGSAPAAGCHGQRGQGRSSRLEFSSPRSKSVPAAASGSALPHSSHQGAGRNPYRWGTRARRRGDTGVGRTTRWGPAPAVLALLLLGGGSQVAVCPSASATGTCPACVL